MKRDRVPKLLHGVISNFLRDSFPLTEWEMLLTVTEVILSPDGGSVKVLVSGMPLKGAGEVAKEKAALFMETLWSLKGDLKRRMVEVLGKRIRKIPEPSFVYDSSGGVVSRVSRLLVDLERRRES